MTVPDERPALPSWAAAEVEAAALRGPALVRDGRTDDMAAVQAIYAAHVQAGTGSFEETPPDLAEMIHRHRVVTDQRLPYVVAERHGRILGFAYAASFRPRSAYRFTVEDSVYVAPAAAGQGLGARLLGEVIDRCTAMGYRQMVAMIGDSANTPSIRLHARLGFRHAGTLNAVGLKFGQWRDVVFMQRPLGDADRTLPTP